MLTLVLSKMGKDGPGDEERNAVVFHGEWSSPRRARGRIKAEIENVMMQKLKSAGDWLKMLAVPAHHTLVQIEAEVTPRSRILLD